jgi:hypothetical protein
VALWFKHCAKLAGLDAAPFSRHSGALASRHAETGASVLKIMETPRRSRGPDEDEIRTEREAVAKESIVC